MQSPFLFYQWQPSLELEVSSVFNLFSFYAVTPKQLHEQVNYKTYESVNYKYTKNKQTGIRPAKCTCADLRYFTLSNVQIYCTVFYLFSECRYFTLSNVHIYFTLHIYTHIFYNLLYNIVLQLECAFTIGGHNFIIENLMPYKFV